MGDFAGRQLFSKSGKIRVIFEGTRRVTGTPPSCPPHPSTWGPPSRSRPSSRPPGGHSSWQACTTDTKGSTCSRRLRTRMLLTSPRSLPSGRQRRLQQKPQRAGNSSSSWPRTQELQFPKIFKHRKSGLELASRNRHLRYKNHTSRKKNSELFIRLQGKCLLEPPTLAT